MWSEKCEKKISLLIQKNFLSGCWMTNFESFSTTKSSQNLHPSPDLIRASHSKSVVRRGRVSSGKNGGGLLIRNRRDGADYSAKWRNESSSREVLALTERATGRKLRTNF